VAAAIFAFGLATLALAFFHVGGGWSGGVMLLLISGVFALVAIRMPDLWMERLAQRPSRQKRGR